LQARIQRSRFETRITGDSFTYAFLDYIREARGLRIAPSGPISFLPRLFARKPINEISELRRTRSQLTP
jgi:hypothetical protein